MSIERLAQLSAEQQELLGRLLREKAQSRIKRFPLSFAQQRLWVLDQMEGGRTAAYSVPTALRLTGSLDAAALERSFGEVVRRHEALRTTFESNALTGTPEQLIHPSRPFHLETMDLAPLPEDERAHEARRISNEEAQTPFDLSKGPLIRAKLLRLAPEEHLLLLTLHHIVSDMWSTSVLTGELTSLYEAYSRGDESPLPDLPIQYVDYAHWQRSRLTGNTLERQLGYWRSRLGGRLPVLELPTRGPRPSLHSVSGAEKTWTLDLATTEAIRRFSHQKGATLFMTLLAAFKVLLYRYTSQDDILVGTPIANRGRREIEGLIGLFINTLVLRTDLSGDPSFCVLLDRVKDVALGAYAHQEAPFEKLVEELQPERETSRTPLFQVMFALQNVPPSQAHIDQLQISPYSLDVKTAKFDLTLAILEVEEGLIGAWEYNTDLFDHSMIERMMGHYGTLLNNILACPGQSISRLSILTQSERDLLLADAYRSAPNPPHVSLVTWFESRVASNPESHALVFEGQRLSYRELNDRANRLAHHLRSLGVTRESLVGISVERSVEMIVGLLGILKAGGAYVPLDPAYPRDRLGFVLEDAKIRVLLTQQRMLEALPEHSAKVVCLDSDWPAIQAASGENLEVGLAPENLAYVIYTSGSTGKPKGVLVTHGHVGRLFTETQPWFNFGDGDVWSFFHSYAFDFSVWELWGALLYGGRLVVVPYLISRSPEAFYELLCREHVTVLNQTPSAFRQLVQAEETLQGGKLNLRLVIFGGEALDIPGLRPWFDRHGDENPQLVNMYGITETTVHVTYRPLTRQDSAPGGGSVIGVPIPDLQLYILDKHLEPAPIDVPGEMYVGGAGVSRGYLNRPDLTAERLVPDPFGRRAGMRLYKTGDSARRLANGDVEYLGRIDQQVKIRGFRIELGEIEATLSECPAVREAVVIAKGSGTGDKRLVAYVVVERNNPPSFAELRGLLKQNLPDYMLPAAFVAVDALPLTPNGKIDRRALPEPDEDRPGVASLFVPPQNEVEKTLVEIWCDVLGAKEIGIDDNFFELGGDSIRTIQALSKLRKKGFTLTLQQLFQHQNIRELARELHAAEGQVASPESVPFGLITDEDRSKLPANVVDAYPLTLLQAGMLFHSHFDPGAAVYHNIGSYHLRAPLDLDALRHAVRNLLARHPVLRTSFDLASFSEPMQLVHESVPLPLEVNDLTHLDEAAQDKVITDWIESEKDRPFDWSRAPLIRFHVHVRSKATFQFGMTEHHAILDGWSVATLLTELFQSYFTLLDRRLDPTNPPGDAFRDFVSLERKALASEECRSYWRDKLRDGTITIMPRWPSSYLANDLYSSACSEGPLNVPLSHVVDVAVSFEVSEGLKRVARNEQVPLKSILLAVHLRVMSLVSGQTDVITGVVTHGRPERTDAERVLGLFLNTLPFRQTLGGGAWAQLARETFETERELMPFRYYQMAQIQRDLGGQPLFETVFNFTNFHVFQNLEGLTNLDVLSSSLFAQTNLTFWANFSLDSSSPIIRLTLSGDAGQLCREQMDRLAGYYARTLEAIAVDPHDDYSAFDLLSEQERDQLIVHWNDTQVRYPAVESITRLFESQVERTPQAVALVSGPDRLTYADLNRRANHLARYLQSLGVGPETRVAVCLRRSAEMVVALFGVLKAGGAYVPLDAAYPQQRLEFMLRDSDAAVVVTEQYLADRLGGHAVRLVLADSFNGETGSLDEEDEKNLPPSTSAENLAYVIYTSGSTGMPKGVAIEHRSALAFLHWAKDVFSAEEWAGVLASTSICFDLSVFELFGPLSWGGRVVLVDNALEIASVDRAEPVRLVNTVPSAMAELVNAGAVPDSVTTANLAGEPLRDSLAQRVYEQSSVKRVFNLYGPSEDTTYSTFALVQRGVGVEPPIGRPIANTRAHVLDERLHPAPIGTPGELYLGGYGLARGYLNRPALTAERFIPDPFARVPGSRLYKTGDLARFIPDGNLEFLGRIDHQIKIRGFRIELGEIEAALLKHPAVREATVIDRDGGSGDKQLVAYVVAAGSDLLSASEVRVFLKEKLPDYFVPSAFIFIEDMPLTPNGKVDRRALRAMDTSPDETERVIVAPRDLLESQLARIWENVLNFSPVSVTDNFFDIGGHSLLAVRLAAQIKASLGRDLPLSALVHAPSVEALAVILRQDTELERGLPVVTLQAAGSKPPLFFVHPIGGNILCYVELARAAGTARPFHALQAPGLNGECAPFTRVEDLAAHYLRAVRSVQPQGPYCIGGWSFGGVVAFEMARQLQADGDEVDRLALLDSRAPAASGWAKGLSEDDGTRLLVEFFSDLCRMAGTAVSFADLPISLAELRRLSKDEQFARLLERAKAMSVLPAGAGVSEIARLYKVFECNARARDAYAPSACRVANRVLLLRASNDRDGSLDDPPSGWRQLVCGQLEVCDVSGDHYTMIGRPLAAGLAVILREFLE